MTVSRRLRAELVKDGGSAATETEFFRSESFLRAEGVTHSLVVDDGRVAIPVVCREIPGGFGYDATSPYGYPGARVRGGSVHVDEIDFSGTGLVSVFLRDQLGPSGLRGGATRGTVLVHDPSIPRYVHARTATKARSNERRGYRVQSAPGPAVDGPLLAAFVEVYKQTMHRADAAEGYFFGAGYLRSCLDSDNSWLVSVCAPDGDMAAAAIVVRSDDHLHYYLGGTADTHRNTSPAKNLMIGLADLADSMSVPLNLGGGLSTGDSLHVFKAQFANSEDTFVTHGIVCDPRRYAELSYGIGRDGYFPIYRAPRATVR